MRIGNLTIGAGAWLAPMAGITDLTFRLLCREMGCALSFTEMISAKGHLGCPPGVRSVEQLTQTLPGERVAAQLFGHEPEVCAEAARRLEALGRFCALDLNMGCPAPKIVKSGDGAALLRDVRLAARIIAAVRAAVRLPLTVKMRLGWDGESLSALELARAAEGEGADAVIVHGRTREQFYAGEADWERIARIKAAVGIPVIGNGDVDSPEAALRRMEESGCDAVMVGRAALGDPWVFRRIALGLRAAKEKGERTAAGESASESMCAPETGKISTQASEAIPMSISSSLMSPQGSTSSTLVSPQGSTWSLLSPSSVSESSSLSQSSVSASTLSSLPSLPSSFSSSLPSSSSSPSLSAPPPPLSIEGDASAVPFDGRPTAMERVETALRHAAMMAVWKGEAVAMREMRKHFSWYLRSFPGCVEARRRCNEATTLREAEAILWGLLGGGDAVPPGVETAL